MTKIKRLTKKELKELVRILELFERQTYNECCTGKLSGEFALAEMADYDNEVIDIELKYGIQSDCENTVHTEQWKLKRYYLTQIMTIKDKVAKIYD